MTTERTNGMRTIILNQTYGSTNPARITFLFPTNQVFEECEVAVANLSLFYSWFNITSQYGNNTVSYQWPTSTGTMQTYSITLPDGSYNIDDINNYIQLQMENNGTYLLDANNLPVYYMNLIVNVTYYCVTLTVAKVPSVLPTGFSLPSNYPGALPPTPTAPLLVVPDAAFPAGSNSGYISSMSQVLGFLPGTWPQGTALQANGTVAPRVDTITTVNVSCNLVNNGLVSSYPQVIYSFSPADSFGSQIVQQPPQWQWFEVVDGQYNSITVQLNDDYNNILNLHDPTWSITLLVRQEKRTIGTKVKTS